MWYKIFNFSDLLVLFCLVVNRMTIYLTGCLENWIKSIHISYEKGIHLDNKYPLQESYGLGLKIDIWESFLQSHLDISKGP